MRKILFTFTWIAILSLVSPSRILVLVDNLNIQETHTIFLKSLEERGHSITLKSADDQSLSIRKFGVQLYDNLIILAPSVDEFGGTVSVKEITDFIDNGGNVLVAGGPQVGDSLRDLATENGFEFDDDKTAVIDHLNYDTVIDEGDHTTILAQPTHMMSAPMIVGDISQHTPVLFRGVALIADKSNQLRMELLTASTTAYSFNPNHDVDDYPAAIGRSIVLVAGLQTRNNARVLFTGSLDMFSDAFISANIHKIGGISKPSRSGNLQFITEISKWVLKEKGVLRVKSVSHHRIGEKHPPMEYTITDKVEYTIDIEELTNGKWVPFKRNDVQLEFVRIDPFIRTTLKNKGGKLTAEFMIPDVYGVFKFLVDYRRVGYTHLFDVQQVSVRPLEHTQYERFIRSAYPYYASSFSMMFGLVLFSMIFLHHKEGSREIKKD